MINLPNIQLNPYEQHLVARRSTALVHSVEQFFCCCLTLSTHYLNLVSPNPHSGRGSNNHPAFRHAIHELIDLHYASLSSHHLTCSLRRPVLQSLCWPHLTSRSSSTSWGLWGLELCTTLMLWKHHGLVQQHSDIPCFVSHFPPAFWHLPFCCDCWWKSWTGVFMTLWILYKIEIF